jgi:hypothetical protein
VQHVHQGSTDCLAAARELDVPPFYVLWRDDYTAWAWWDPSQLGPDQGWTFIAWHELPYPTKMWEGFRVEPDH